MLDPLPASSRYYGVTGHGVSPQEPRHPASDGLGMFDVQEMADTIDRAVLDVRE